MFVLGRPQMYMEPMGQLGALGTVSWGRSSATKGGGSSGPHAGVIPLTQHLPWP